MICLKLYVYQVGTHKKFISCGDVVQHSSHSGFCRVVSCKVDRNNHASYHDEIVTGTCTGYNYIVSQPYINSIFELLCTYFTLAHPISP